MKKKLLLLVTLTALMTGCGQIPKLSNGDEALAELKDGTKYSANEVWEEVKETYGMDIILKKIDKKILEDTFKDKKNDVEDYIKGLETSIRANYKTEKDLNDALSYYGYSSLDQYLETAKLSRYEELATKEYAKTKVTDKEINNYYKNTAKGDISCLHVLVKPEDTTDGAKEEALKKAEQIIKDIDKEVKDGKNVEDVFKSYKNNKDVTFEDLGYFNLGKMDSTFEEEAYKLKKGTYSNKPVKSSYGYHVILKVDELEKESLDKIKDSIIDTLADKKIEEDSKMNINAMIELRKENDVKFYDSKIENAYKKYINYLLNK